MENQIRKAILLALVIAFVALTLAFIMIGNADADQVTLQWDYNDPAPDGYLLYQRQDDGTYNYGQAVVIPGTTNDQGDIPPTLNTVTITGLGVICNITDYYWVVRAYLDRSGTRDTSGDSNEVTMRVDWDCPIAVTNFQATFNYETSEINMGFEQTGNVPVDNWKIYSTTTPGENYQLFDTVTNDGSNTPTITKPFTDVAEGDRQTIYFTVVSFRFADNADIHSPNATEVAVDIDRRTTPQAPSLRVVTIPVQ
jgi:hypothetical protein